MQFEYNIAEKGGNTFLITVNGDLVGESIASSFMEEICLQIDTGRLQAVMDLTHLGFINSSGIGVLITILTKLRNKGGELVLANPSEKLNKLLAMTKLLAIFKIVDSVDNANSILNQ